MEEIIDKPDLTKKLCPMKDNIKRMIKRNWEKILGRNTSDKGLLAKVKKKKNTVKTQQSDPSRHLITGDIQMARLYIRGYST